MILHACIIEQTLSIELLKQLVYNNQEFIIEDLLCILKFGNF